MKEIDLTDEEQRVLAAVASLEVDRDAVRAEEIAQETDFDQATAQRVLSTLASEHNLLRELAGPDPDLGPHYRVKDTAASA